MHFSSSCISDSQLDFRFSSSCISDSLFYFPLVFAFRFSSTCILDFVFSFRFSSTCILDFRPLVFSIFIHLYSLFDFRSIRFSSTSILGSLSRRGPKVGGSVVPSARMESHVCTCIPSTYYRALGVLYQM